MPDQRYNPGKFQGNLGWRQSGQQALRLGQLQIRQFGTLWWHLSLIVLQDRLDLTGETG